MTDTPFTGFSDATFAFLKDLRDNNNREWFADNRKRYEQDYLAPAFALVTALESTAAGLTPPHKAEARINGSLRRINRDVRFSKNKSPYNVRIHLVFWTGDHPNRSSAVHFVLHPEGIGYGAGQWALTPAQLDRYRKNISDDRRRIEFKKLLKQAENIGCTMEPPALKKVPKGFEAPDEWSDLLKHKSLVARTLHDVPPPAVLGQAEAAEYVADIMKKLAPFNRWINANIG